MQNIGGLIQNRLISIQKNPKFDSGKGNVPTYHHIPLLVTAKLPLRRRAHRRHLPLAPSVALRPAHHYRLF